ncbi:hypothetical protein STCU_09075 [Strigomonas culicis]|uniref:Protein phosphatase 1 regulatory subunit 7 n=1 Tax=Strigomonas culicis TaxID=28005 RepID=S9TUN2_9TRYP|nr:hypothetical protein STCU_09075 [Strigomonas culicis]|eukprot:EPY20268.1 hypothetical protein STCU_09075 [Strigomonas culicis]
MSQPRRNSRPTTGSVSGRLSSVTLSPEQIEKMKKDIQEGFRNADTEEALTVMGENNGWSRAMMLTTPHLMTEMHMFLMTFSRIPQIRFFPQLSCVKLMHVGLQSMQDISCLTLMEELWLVDNDIQKIEGLQSMPRLRKLFLQGNRITSMEGLQHTKYIRELWLCRNQITAITHVQHMTHLRALWMAGNPIASLSNLPFSATLSRLNELNLSGCQLHSLDDVAHIAVLPCLRKLWFADPLFGPNPLSQLNNYTTFTVHIVHSLEELDFNAIMPEQRGTAEAIHAKKAMYYKARVASVEKNWNVLERRTSQAVDAKVKALCTSVRDLSDALAPIAAELAERQAYAAGTLLQPEATYATSALDALRADMERAIGTHTVAMQKLLTGLRSAVERSSALQQRLRERLCAELHSGGNIKLEEGGPKDEWFQAAVDAIQSQFDVKRFTRRGIKGVRVNRVRRIVNRGQRLHFDHVVKGLCINMAEPTHQAAFVSLAAPVAPQVDLQDAVLQHALVYGVQPAPCTDPATTQYLRLTSGQREGFPLTNSLFVADELRLREAEKQRTSLTARAAGPGLLSAQVVLCRAYVGACEQLKGPTQHCMIAEHVYAKVFADNVLSAFRVDEEDKNVAVWHMFDRTLVVPEWVVDYTYLSEEVDRGGDTEECLGQPDVFQDFVGAQLPNVDPADWLDVLDFGTPLLEVMQQCQKESTADTIAQAEVAKVQSQAESVVSTAEAKASSASTSAPLSVHTLGTYAQQLGTTVEDLSFVQLRWRKITAVPDTFCTATLSSLTSLDLSKNDISTFAWAAVSTTAPNLQYLFLRDNNLAVIDAGSAVFAQLLVLDISNNVIDDVRAFEGVPRTFPSLRSLQTEGNLFILNRPHQELYLTALLTESIMQGQLVQINQLRWELPTQQSVARLLYDRTLDFSLKSVETGDSNTSLALQYVVQVANAAAWDPERTMDVFSLDGAVVPYRFYEAAITGLCARPELTDPQERSRFMLNKVIKAIQRMNARSPRKTSNASAQEPLWHASLNLITTFAYSSSLTRALDFCESLVNLRHLFLRNHFIASLAPVLSLHKLETLDVQGNQIAVLPSLVSLTHLRVVNLGFNNLTSVAEMGVLRELVELNVNGNRLSSLDTDYIAQLKQLKVLLLAYNELNDTAEFYALREVPAIEVLDMSGNPLEGDNTPEDAFLYFVYHFKQLKMLNGQPIAPSTVQKANSEFAGRMSGDMVSERVKVPESSWGSVVELDLSRCGLREVSMLDRFPSLIILRLEYNTLSRVDAVAHLRYLRALDLSHNRVGSVPASSPAIGDTLRGLPQLESLSLASNGIDDLVRAALDLPRLKFLNLSQNGLTVLDRGLDRLPQLRELLVDGNRLREFGAECFANCTMINIVSANDNVLRAVEGLAKLRHLKTLSIGANRLADVGAVLSVLVSTPVSSLLCIGNPMARKTQYRATVLSCLTNLRVLDKQAVSAEERMQLPPPPPPPDTVTSATPQFVLDMNGTGAYMNVGLALLHPTVGGRMKVLHNQSRVDTADGISGFRFGMIGRGRKL